MHDSILFIYNIPAPYRVEFLNLLSSKIKIKVIFENKNSAHRKKEWLTNKMYFSHSFINSSFINFIKLLKEVNIHEKVVLGGYSTRLSIFLIIYMKLIRKKFTLNADGGFIKNDKFLYKHVKRWLISSATYWLSSGDETSRYLMNYGAKKENIFTYPFTSVYYSDISSTDEILKSELKDSLLNTDKKVVLYVGSFIPIKGIEKLIMAANLIPEVLFVFVGGNPTYNQQKLVGNHDNIIFINHLTKIELQNYYKLADLFVFPTQGDVWGLVINEAVANNLPIITTDRCIAGIEMIKDGMGEIVPHDIKPSQLAEVIQKSLINIKDFNYLRIKNKAEEYTLEKMCESHVEILNRIFREV